MDLCDSEKVRFEELPNSSRPVRSHEQAGPTFKAEEFHYPGLVSAVSKLPVLCHLRRLVVT